MTKKICNFNWCVIILIIISACQNNVCTTKINEPVYLHEKYPNLTFGICANAIMTELNNEILFCFKGRKYPVAVIEKETGVKSTSNNFFIRLENFIEELYLKNFFHTIQNKPEDESYWTMKRHMMDTLTSGILISDEEAQEYHKRNYIWFEGSSYDQVADDIKKLTYDDKRERVFKDYIMKAGTSTPILLSKSWIEKAAPTLYNHPLYTTLNNGRPSVIIFSYGCCKPDVMLPEIESLHHQSEEKINITHIDNHNEPEITDRFRVKHNPTTLIFNNEGELKYTLDYYYSADEIIHRIQEMKGSS